MNKANRVFAVILIFVSIITFFLSSGYPAEVSAWPRFFAGVLIILSVGMIIDSFISPKREAEIDVYGILKTEGKFAGIILLVTIVYLLLMKYIGFLIMTPFYIGFILKFLSYGNWRKILTLSVVIPFVIIVVFQVFLTVPLPQGILTDFINQFRIGGAL